METELEAMTTSSLSLFQIPIPSQSPLCVGDLIGYSQ